MSAVTQRCACICHAVPGAVKHTAPCCYPPPVTADHTPERLSAEERKALRRDLDDVISSNATWAEDPITSQIDAALDVTEEHFERLLAARLADVEARLAVVEALCDESENPPLHSMIPLGCVRASEVRAALHPAPSEQPAQGGDGT